MQTCRNCTFTESIGDGIFSGLRCRALSITVLRPEPPPHYLADRLKLERGLEVRAQQCQRYEPAANGL
jgi:hypothetical protein